MNQVQIVYCDNPKKCLEMVKSEEADATYLNNYIANFYLEGYRFGDLYSVQITEYSDNISVGISRAANPLLVRIINKSLLGITNNQVNEFVLSQTAQKEQVTLITLIYQYPVIFIQIVSVIILILILFFTILLRQKSKKAKMLRKISETDNLTGVYNRMASEVNITKAMEQDQKRSCFCPLISIDLDNFKNVNDTYGHPEGDKLLKAVAATLRDLVDAEGIVGRMGGDEFIVHLRGMENQQNLEKAVQEIQKAGRELAEQKEEWYKMSFSMGAVVDVSASQSFEELYHRADAALYKAKGAGKNRFVLEYINTPTNRSSLTQI